MEIRKNNLYKIVAILIPLLNQINVGITHVGYGIYIPVLLSVVLSIIFNKKLFLDSKSTYIMFFISYIVLPIVVFHVRNTSTFISILLSLFTFHTVIVFSDQRNTGLRYEDLLWCFLIGNSPVLVFNIITHANQISFNNFYTLLVGARDSRADLGFSHENWLAMYAFTEILLVLFMFRRQLLKPIYSILLISISFLAIISSGSRTAFYCTLILAVCIASDKIIKLTKIRNISKIKYIFPLLCLLAMMLFMFQNDDIEAIDYLIDASSGRDVLNWQSIEYLIRNKYLFLGYAPLTYTQLATFVPLTDCWYVVCIAQVGVVGLLSWLIIFFIKGKHLFALDRYEGMVILSILLCYGALENVVFNAGVSLSVIFLILVFYQANPANKDL